ncbi:MAG: PAS domain S-box protein [Vicinamibacteria bacterium]
MTTESNDETRIPEDGAPRTEDLVAALRRMRAQQEAISAVSMTDAFIAGDVQQLAREITEVAAKATAVERANVWLFNEDESELQCIDLFEATPGRHTSGGVLAESEYGPEFAWLKRSRFVDADDALSDPRTIGYVEGYLKPLRITSMLDAVIEVSGRHLGLLCLEHVDKPHHWERDEVEFACQLADKLALALVNRARRHAQETLRASEERFAGAFEYAPIGLALVSPQGRFTKVNRALCDLVGYPEAALLVRTFQEITHPDDLEADLENVRRLVAGEAHSYQMEKRYLHADGHPVSALLSASLVRGRDGGPEYFISQIQDITARKQAQHDLEASLREKKALLREVHHRVKNNLQVITSLLRLEASRTEATGTKLVLKDMQGRIQSMALLHETLYRTGNFGHLDLSSYLRQLSQQLFRAQSPGSGLVKLTLDLTSVQVEIDHAIPCGLLVNEILSNSLKHAFGEGRSGEVSVVLRPEGAAEVRLDISDNGVGLPADFETRCEKSLGMQLVADLTRQLHGLLEVGRGPGARFTVIFSRGRANTTGVIPPHVPGPV